MRFFRLVMGPIVLLLLVANGLSGCERQQPVYQMEGHVIPQASANLSLKQIEDRITKAAMKNNWRVRSVRPGQLVAMITWRRHSGTVTIDFTQTTYGIHYKSSTNLLYETAAEEQPYSGQKVIHRNFNKRVRALEQAIEVELSFPGS